MMDNINGACCAHLNVRWTTIDLGGGHMRGWWECVDCRRMFVPAPEPDKPKPSPLRMVRENDCCPREEFLPGFGNWLKRLFGTGGCKPP
jgi:hypothetical protein